jgi:putative hemolysin
MKDEVQNVVTTEGFQKTLGVKGPFGRWLTRFLMRVLEIDKVNRTQAVCDQYEGPDFSEHILECVGVRYHLPEGQVEKIPLEGGFITVSNHHFGSLDGLILNAVVGKRRADYRILTTFLLALIPNLRAWFLPVDNLSGNTNARSVTGIRMALTHIASGGGLGFFPAGEVATWQKRKNRPEGTRFFQIQDKPWAPNIVKLVKKSGLPVIPIYFQGRNSLSFHLLGLLHRRLRTVRLVHELFNKRGTLVEVRIGDPIPPEVVAAYDIPALSSFLRESCYALEEDCKKA